MDESIDPGDVLDFWFAAGEDKWFQKNDAFDTEITERFQGAYLAARRGELEHWKESARGCLALIVLFDQFPRNMYRNSAEAFATDTRALALARSMVETGTDMELPENVRMWIYLPFEHSEVLADQEQCMELMRRSRLEKSLEWAQLHLDVICRFGRFPHRNAVLGRTSSPEEIAFLKDGGFAG